MPDQPASESVARWRLELLIQVLIIYSIASHFIEVEIVGSEWSAGYWLWSERLVASIFTIEYFARWGLARSWTYPLRPMAIVDALAILPFYVGFLVDLRSLRLVRSLRVLRLFKFYRYSSALRHLLSAFNRVRHEFAVIGFALFVVGWCSALAIHEVERERQPEIFGRFSDAIWFVLATVTTVGYGDKVPLTLEGKVIAGLTMIAGLVLFGTFVSLIGGSFVEEIRRARGASEVAAKERRCQVEIDANLARKIGAIASARDMTVPDYVNNVLRPIVDRDFPDAMRSLVDD